MNDYTIYDKEREGIFLGNPAYTKKHWVVLLAICLMLGASIGLIVNGNGVFYTPIAEELNSLRGSVAMHGTFLSLATAFASLAVPIFFEYLGWKKTISIGVIFGALGTVLLAFAPNIIIVYISGVIRGIGSAFFSMVPMTMIVNQWFHEKSGLAIGLASGTSGIIGAIAAPSLAYLINSQDWRFAYVVTAIFIVVLSLPALFLPYSFDPRADGLLPYGYKEDEGNNKIIRQQEPTNMHAAKIIFYALMLIGLLNTMVVFVNSHLPGYGESVGLSPEVASLTLSAVMIGNLVSKLFFGIISDKIGTVKTSISMLILSTISILILIFLQEPFFLILGSLLYGTIFSIGGVALPILSNEFFDPATAVKVYSRVNFIASVGGALSVSLVGYIFDFTGSYIPAFVIALAFNAINFIAILVAQRTHQSR